MSTLERVLDAMKATRGVEEVNLVTAPLPAGTTEDKALHQARDLARLASLGDVLHDHVQGLRATSVLTIEGRPSVIMQGHAGALGAWRYAFERHRALLHGLQEVAA